VAEVARAHALDYRALTYRELLTAQQTFPRAMGQRPN
jgi:linoleoyl-CoA desaturase